MNDRSIPKRRFDKTKTNLVIDAVMLVLLMGVAGMGFLIKYILVPGFKRNEIYGGNVELYFLGLDRHQWGAIHFIISLLFLGLLILHIVLHWKMIVAIFRRMCSGSALRRAVACGFGVICVALAASPFLLEPEIRTLEQAQRKDRLSTAHSSVLQHELSPARPAPSESKTAGTQVIEDAATPRKHAKNAAHEIYGYMTLEEVADMYGVSAADLAASLHVPESRVDERLGRLKKEYAFTMRDVQKAAIESRAL